MALLIPRTKTEQQVDMLIKALIELLASKGMDLSSIPAFIRNLAYTLASEPGLTLEELNRRIHSSGWEDFEVDLYTLKLVLATFDPDFSSGAIPHAGILPFTTKDAVINKETSHHSGYQIDGNKTH